MSQQSLTQLKAYRLGLGFRVTRVSMVTVPAELLSLVRVYLDALSAQLSDPESESWDYLGPTEHHIALQAVLAALGLCLYKRVAQTLDGTAAA